MKISFVLGHELPFPPLRGGGVNSLLQGLSVALVRAGNEVTAYSPEVAGRPRCEQIDGVRHRRLPGAERHKNPWWNAFRGLPYALRVRSSLEATDVLSCHLHFSFLFTKSSRARAVTHTIHRDPTRFIRLYSLLDRLYTGSESVSSHARGLAPWMSHRIKTIHNCVDYEDYQYQEQSGAPSVRFLYVGRFSSDKGIEVLIKAFCAAARRCDRISLDAIGPLITAEGGEEELVARLRERIQTAGLGSRIRIHPAVYERTFLDQMTRDSDVVCLPSIAGETLNMSVIESMRIGRCLLLSDLPANLPLIEPNKTGLLARAGDLASWESAILQLAADPSRVREFGRQAFSYGQRCFSSSVIAEEYMADFETFVGSRGDR